LTPAPAPDVAGGGFSLRQVGRSAFWLALATILGQVAVLGRELFVAANAGTSRELDALLVAFVVPTFVAGVGFSGVQAALVPAYSAVTRDGGRQAAQRFAGGVLGWIAVAATAALAVTVVLGSAAISIAGPGFGPEDQRVALGFLPILLPIMILLPIGTVLAAVCQAQGRFGFIAAATVAGSVGSSIATVLLWPQLGIWALAVSFVINAVAVLCVLAAGLWRAGSLPVPRLHIDRKYSGPFARHLLPLSAGTALFPFNLLADRAIASFLAVGGVSALRYGEQLIHGPLNAVSGAWGTVILPALVSTTHDESGGSTGDAAGRALRYIGAGIIPIGAAVAALAPLLVGLLYERGAFDADAASRTIGVVVGLAPLVPLSMAMYVLTGAHNARRRGALIGMSAVMTAALNLGLNLVLVRPFGVAGIALATSLTSFMVLLLLAWRLSRLEPGFDGRATAACWARAAIASAVAAAPSVALVWGGVVRASSLPGLVWLVLLVLLGVGLYLLASNLLRLREPAVLVGGILEIARARLRRS
jgi:putative peptidoglycan lipid II flippase